MRKKRRGEPLWIAWGLVLLLLFLAACGRGEDSSGVEENGQKEAYSFIEAPETPEEEEKDTAEEGDEPAAEEPWSWPIDSPENQGLSSAVVEAVHGRFDSFPLLAACIVKNGVLVDSYYKAGFDASSLFLLNSASKSVTSALVGIAIDKGYIQSVDDPLSRYLPQVLELDDPNWQQITLRHLLTHTSGIATTDDVRWEEWRGSENWIDYILALPILSQPGTAFSYSTGNTHLLSAVLQQATGQTLSQFGTEYLFHPVGMDSARVDPDPQGISDGGNGIWMTVEDMAKMGQLYLNRGQWEGQQVISSAWVDQSTQVQFQRSSGSADYGYQWWVRTFGSQAYPAYFAQGHGGQYIFVVPQLQLVVAWASDYTGATSIYWDLVNQIVEGCAPPAA